MKCDEIILSFLALQQCPPLTLHTISDAAAASQGRFKTIPLGAPDGRR